MEQSKNLPEQMIQSAENHIRQLENLLNVALNRPQREFAPIDIPIQIPDENDHKSYTTTIFHSDIFGEGKDAFIPVTNPDGTTSYVTPERANQNNAQFQKLPTDSQETTEYRDKAKKDKQNEQIRNAQKKQKERVVGSILDKINKLTDKQKRQREDDVKEGLFHIAPVWQKPTSTNAKNPRELTTKQLRQMERDNPAEYYRYLNATGKNQFGFFTTPDEIERAKQNALKKGYNLEDYTKAPDDQNVDSENYDPESTNTERNDGPSENEILYQSQSLGYDTSEIRAMYKNGELP